MENERRRWEERNREFETFKTTSVGSATLPDIEVLPSAPSSPLVGSPDADVLRPPAQEGCAEIALSEGLQPHEANASEAPEALVEAGADDDTDTAADAEAGAEEPGESRIMAALLAAGITPGKTAFEELASRAEASAAAEALETVPEGVDIAEGAMLPSPSAPSSRWAESSKRWATRRAKRKTEALRCRSGTPSDGARSSPALQLEPAEDDSPSNG